MPGSLQFGSSAGFWNGFLLCSLLGWLVMTPNLQGQPNGQNTGGAAVDFNEASVAAPAAPSNLAAIAMSNTQIKLTWMDNSTNETGFWIERKTGATGSYGTIPPAVGAHAMTGVMSFVDSGLSPNTPYYYHVRAYNNDGRSAPSTDANATTFRNPPAAPSNLTAIAISNTQIKLTWMDNSANEDGFRVERKVGATGNYQQIPLTDGVQRQQSTVIFENRSLSSNTIYFYRVRAYNNGGNSAISNDVSTTTLMNGPSSLVATAAGKQINLAWIKIPASETGFQIERSTAISGQFTRIGTVGRNARSFSDTSTTTCIQYFYRVRAFNAINVSVWSNVASGTAISPVAAPINLKARAVSNRIIIEWQDNSNNEDGFSIERKKVGQTFAKIGQVETDVESYTDLTVIAGTTYFYRVRAIKFRDFSCYSNEANATPPPEPPAAPSDMSAMSASHNQINLAWKDNSNNEDGFKIERKTGAAGQYAQIAMVSANVTTLADANLTSNTTYFYRVRAFNAGGNSAYSNEASTTTFALVAPGNLAATAVSSSEINLTWKDNSNNEDGFKIERKIGAAGQYAQIATRAANVTSHFDMNLISNATYFYRIRAFSAAGHSAYSNEVSAATLSLAAPGNLTATAVSSNQINLVWTDRSSNENGFKIERKIGAAGQYVQIATSTANATSYFNMNLIGNTTYFYRVRAYNALGHSAYSNEASATTRPPIIGKPALESETDGAIPEEISIAPNYPNPFNPATMISFSLPKGVHVSLKIINVTGQEVATLADGYRDHGIHRVAFDAAQLPSGAYYAVLKAGEVTQVRRMTLAR